MSLTPTEEARLRLVEERINDLFRLIDGAGSKNMLNRLYVVLNREIEDLQTKQAALDEDAQELLTYARKAQ